MDERKSAIKERIGLLQPVHKKKRGGFWMGIVKIRELPRDITIEEYLEWWPRLTERERERYTAAEFRNILTQSGRNQLLTFIGSGNTMVQGFSQFFSVGTSPIIAVSAGDTSVQGELFRAAPTTTTITGNQITISTVFGSAQANGNYTNAGLYGVNATSTLGTGTLMTHTLYTYTKTNGTQISNDYLVVLT